MTRRAHARSVATALALAALLAACGDEGRKTAVTTVVQDDAELLHRTP